MAMEEPILRVSVYRAFVRSFGADERSSITNSVVVSSSAPFFALRPEQSGPRPRSEGSRSALLAASCHAIAFPVKVALFSSRWSCPSLSLSLSLSHIVLRTGFLAESRMVTNSVSCGLTHKHNTLTLSLSLSSIFADATFKACSSSSSRRLDRDFSQ